VQVTARRIAGLGRALRGPREFLHPPRGGVHLVEWASELVGTFVLVFGGLSAVVLDFGTGSPVAPLVPSASARLLLTGLLFAGCGSLVAISPPGRRSGAHLNPAVSFAFFCRRHLHPGDLAGYVVAQCGGALAGAFALRLAWGTRAASVHDGLTAPGRGLSALEAAGVEALMTAVLVGTILVFVSSARTARFTPLAVWIVVAVLVWKGAPYTGTSLNPARSLGPAVVTGDFHELWAYVAGPVGGSAVAVALFALVPRATLTAKLFHDPAYRSVLGSALPVAVALPASEAGRPQERAPLEAADAPAPPTGRAPGRADRAG
jgi:aquaporin Z